MDFETPLLPGTLVKRYKRFLADVDLGGGGLVTAHCANPGSMTGLTEPGSEVWLSPATNPKRKLKYTWELIRPPGGSALVGINTMRPNAIAEEAIGDGLVAELAGFSEIRREVRYGRNSRIDLLLESPDRPPCYVEIKNVHLSRQSGLAEFPDSVTVRGTKHLHELADMAASGARAVMFYLVQRDDCDSFAPAADIDPTYAETLAEVRPRGVEAICYACRLSPQSISVERRLPFA
ncbi:MAG TPA: DNA/RNA nuclease SfsA [Alphaproteobacteria bacterium]|nr:DNA/RNA nuclease SfsA [Alphaproteobacteria bacterium]